MSRSSKFYPDLLSDFNTAKTLEDAIDIANKFVNGISDQLSSVENRNLRNMISGNLYETQCKFIREFFRSLKRTKYDRAHCASENIKSICVFNDEIRCLNKTFKIDKSINYTLIKNLSYFMGEYRKYNGNNNFPYIKVEKITDKHVSVRYNNFSYTFQFDSYGFIEGSRNVNQNIYDYIIEMLSEIQIFDKTFLLLSPSVEISRILSEVKDHLRIIEKLNARIKEISNL